MRIREILPYAALAIGISRAVANIQPQWALCAQVNSEFSLPLVATKAALAGAVRFAFEVSIVKAPIFNRPRIAQ
jgi:hypothetical protein